MFTKKQIRKYFNEIYIPEFNNQVIQNTKNQIHIIDIEVQSYLNSIETKINTLNFMIKNEDYCSFIIFVRNYLENYAILYKLISCSTKEEINCFKQRIAFNDLTQQRRIFNKLNDGDDKKNSYLYNINYLFDSYFKDLLLEHNDKNIEEKYDILKKMGFKEIKFTLFVEEQLLKSHSDLGVNKMDISIIYSLLCIMSHTNLLATFRDYNSITGKFDNNENVQNIYQMLNLVLKSFILIHNSLRKNQLLIK